MLQRCSRCCKYNDHLSSSPSPLKLWVSPQVENTTSSLSSPLKWRSSSSPNTMKHSMNTHTHTHDRLDLRVGQILCSVEELQLGPKVCEMHHHYRGGSSFTYPNSNLVCCAFSQQTTKILHFIYQIYRSPKVSFHIDKTNNFVFFKKIEFVSKI